MKNTFSILLVLVLLLGLTVLTPATVFAADETAQINQTESKEQQGVVLRWSYAFVHETTRVYGYNDTVVQSFRVGELVGYDSATGQPVFAYGDVTLTGTVYGFPTANQKTCTYRGVLSAHGIIGELINRP